VVAFGAAAGLGRAATGDGVGAAVGRAAMGAAGVAARGAAGLAAGGEEGLSVGCAGVLGDVATELASASAANFFAAVAASSDGTSSLPLEKGFWGCSLIK